VLSPAAARRPGQNSGDVWGAWLRRALSIDSRKGRDMKKIVTILGLMGTAALTAVGCGGNGGIVATGEHAVYRIASSETTFSDGCDQEIDELDSTNLRAGATLLVYAIPGGDSDTLFLDIGSTVLSGASTDVGYKFSGEDVDGQEIGGTTIFDSDHDGIDDQDDTMIDSDKDGLDDESFMDEFVDVDGDSMDDRFDDDIVDANGDDEDDRIVELPGDTKVTIKTAFVVSMDVDGTSVKGEFKQTISNSCSGAKCDGFEEKTCTRTNAFVGVELPEADITVSPGGGIN
jgi:hypothetical protein